MKVVYRKSFLRDLRKTRDREALRRVADCLRELERAASLGELSHVRPLAGAPGFYRVRIGDYRLGLAAGEEAVEVVRFLHRRDVYRYFP